MRPFKYNQKKINFSYLIMEAIPELIIAQDMNDSQLKKIQQRKQENQQSMGLMYLVMKKIQLNILKDTLTKFIFQIGM